MSKRGRKHPPSSSRALGGTGAALYTSALVRCALGGHATWRSASGHDSPVLRPPTNSLCASAPGPLARRTSKGGRTSATATSSTTPTGLRRMCLQGGHGVRGQASAEELGGVYRLSGADLDRARVGTVFVFVRSHKHRADCGRHCGAGQDGGSDAFAQHVLLLTHENSGEMVGETTTSPPTGWRNLGLELSKMALRRAGN